MKLTADFVRTNDIKSRSTAGNDRPPGFPFVTDVPLGDLPSWNDFSDEIYNAFRFADVEVGETYVFTVFSKEYRFNSPALEREIVEETVDVYFFADN